MKAVLQVASDARLSAGDRVISECKKGLVVLLGIERSDTKNTLDRMIDKILKMRLFPDENGKIGLSALTLGADILVVSNFTLCATPSSRRPDFQNAMPGKEAKALYELFLEKMKQKASEWQTQSAPVRVFPGAFGEDMTIRTTLSGPITVVLDSETF